MTTTLIATASYLCGCGNEVTITRYMKDTNYVELGNVHCSNPTHFKQGRVFLHPMTLRELRITKDEGDEGNPDRPS
jgi:hypothetical protein